MKIVCNKNLKMHDETVNSFTEGKEYHVSRYVNSNEVAVIGNDGFEHTITNYKQGRGEKWLNHFTFKN